MCVFALPDSFSPRVICTTTLEVGVPVSELNLSVLYICSIDMCVFGHSKVCFQLRGGDSVAKNQAV